MRGFPAGSRREAGLPLGFLWTPEAEERIGCRCSDSAAALFQLDMCGRQRTYYPTPARTAMIHRVPWQKPNRGKLPDQCSREALLIVNSACFRVYMDGGAPRCCVRSGRGLMWSSRCARCSGAVKAASNGDTGTVPRGSRGGQGQPESGVRE